MKKKYKIIILLIIILVFSTVIVFRFYGSRVENNWYNDKVRDWISRSPFLRTLYGLHWDGDAKYDFLMSDRYQKLIVEIDATRECQLYFQDVSSLQKKISDLVQKLEGVEVVMSDIIDDDEMIFVESNTLERAMDHLKTRLRDYQPKGDTVSLHVLCFDKNRDDLSTIGLTYQESTIFLFYDRIVEITASNPAAIPIYLETTLLHELGHQLGLDHLDDENCIMAETVESPGNTMGSIEQIPTSFCQASLERIEEIKNRYFKE